MNKFFGHMVVNNRNVLSLRIFDFPRRGFHFRELGAHHDFYIFAAQAARCAAAVHCGVTATQNQYAFADLMNVLEGD